MSEQPQKPSCACDAAPRLIFACSGASDVGQISDLAARQLTAEGAGKMYCLAGVGGRVSGILANTRAAQSILAIDGCPLDCAKKLLEHAGFADFEHICLTDLGLEKGKTTVTEDVVASVVKAGKATLVA